MKPRLLCAVGIGVLASAYGQSERRTFEAASVRLNKQCNVDGPSRGASSPTMLALECADLRDLIVTAYGIYADGTTPVPGRFRMQVSGGPRWIDSDRFEIAATAAPRSTQAEILGPMLRALLEDRFHLKVHRETKQGPVYRLTVAKNGAKLQPGSERNCAVRGPTCGTVSIHSDGKVDFEGVTMTDLCTRLSMVLDREVIDTTGLTGKYDFRLEVAPGDLNPRFVAGRDQVEVGDSNSVERGSSIFSALTQQLGLRLDLGVGVLERIIVDQIDHPSEN